MRHRGGIALLALAAVLLARPAGADTLRVVRPVNLAALPLLVMEHEHLIERTAQRMGLGDLTVTWVAPDKTDTFAALGSGQADLAMTDVVPFLLAADAGANGANAVQALGAIAQRPYVLVTRNKAINTILDFSDADRIAVPDAKASGPAVLLEMAAADEWGPEHYDKLDRLMVARPDETAAEQLISGKGDIDAHFSRSPYVDGELGDPGIHRVMDSFDIAGPHTVAVLAMTSQFGTSNPELCKAILAALQAADDYITKSRGEAAEIFSDMTKGQVPLEDLSDMIGDPDAAYRAAPSGVMRIAAFLQRIGRLKRAPQRWQDLFSSAASDLPGS